MAEETQIEVAPLPPGLAPFKPTPQAAPSPSPSKPAPSTAKKPEVEEDEDDEEENPLDGLDMNEFCGATYSDVFSVYSNWCLGSSIVLPEARIKQRGRGLAFALKALGWDDAKIILAVSLAAGVTGDILYVEQLRKEAKDKADKEAEKPKGGAA